MIRTPTVIRAATSLAAAALFALSALPLAAQDETIEVGSKAPASAVVETLDGKPFDLGQYVGKTPVVIEFWATWCALCKELEPAMRAAAARYGPRVKFVGVAVSVNQSPERVRRFAEAHKLPMEIVYDRKGNATEAYGVMATSTVVVLDARGTVVYTGQGGKQDIDGAVRKALGK
jgi:peroxiredoxin